MLQLTEKEKDQKKKLVKLVMEQKLYQNHLTILKSELITALGCTEPIAIAYEFRRLKGN